MTTPPNGTWSWIWPALAEAPLMRSMLLFCAACSMTYLPFAVPVPVQCSWSSSRAGWPCASRKSWNVPRTCRSKAMGKEQLAESPG
jgi:hypothetical protein